jgi:hypothetical protein
VSFDQQQQDFMQPQAWEMSGTGLTPVGGGGEVDVMNMSDADWNQMMEGLGDWNSTVLGGV